MPVRQIAEAHPGPDAEYRARVAHALDEALQRARMIPAIDVGSGVARYIIFSDQHKGARNGADDFRRCERAYNAALAYYLRHGHTLIELGDVEELWEERPGTVVERYRRTLELAAEFHRAGRYVRIWGNHDDAWSFEAQVEQHLHPIFGSDLVVHEGVRIPVVEGGAPLGDIFLAHGHQGTAASDRFSRWSRYPVRFVWRPIQRLFGVSLNTPATSWQLRERHNVALYEWAHARDRIMLIAGHTHRPVFLSESLVEQLHRRLSELEAALARKPGDRETIDEIALTSAHLEWARAQGGDSGPEGELHDAGRRRPCYFNTGCCCYLDGDITGLEIVGDVLRLIRWPTDDEKPRPTQLASMSLSAALRVIGVVRAGGSTFGAAPPGPTIDLRR